MAFWGFARFVAFAVCLQIVADLLLGSKFAMLRQTRNSLDSAYSLAVASSTSTLPRLRLLW